MPYKTILVQIDDSPRAAARITLAARLAANDDAHLVGAASSGVADFLLQNAALEYNDPNLSDYFDALRRRAAASLAPFEGMARRLGVRSCETRLLDDHHGIGIEQLAHCADLVVAGQAARGAGRDQLEMLLLHGARPLLILPQAGPTETRLEKILVAWDGGSEAARAAQGALPLLQRAVTVDVVLFNGQGAQAPDDDQGGKAGHAPGDDFLRYLRRHGVAAELSLQKTDDDVGHALLALAIDLSCDLLVMGGYGHSRFRELLLGGATRTVMDAMHLPVLMAH